MDTTSYIYGSNGSMTNRGTQVISWDVENRPFSIGGSTFVYDGDGKRVKKTEAGVVTVYVNKYYEKNLMTAEPTLYYYLGDKMVAMKKGIPPSGTYVRYVHQEHLTSTSVVTSAAGSQIGSMTYLPFGALRATSGAIETDRKFTGQRLDATGLYYYGARYYDPGLGRFISGDTFVAVAAGSEAVSSVLTVNGAPSERVDETTSLAAHPSPTVATPSNPQALNRYAYVVNNPLRYTDPHGWLSWGFAGVFSLTLFDFVAVSFSVGFTVAWDERTFELGEFYAYSLGAGVGQGLEVNLSLQYATTDATSLSQLEGRSTQVGATTALGLAVGYERVIGEAYTGNNYTLGVGVGREVHVSSEETHYFTPPFERDLRKDPDPEEKLPSADVSDGPADDDENDWF